MEKHSVSIVIPVYNEERILRDAVTALFRDLERFTARFSFEVILAENGSSDGTMKAGRELSEEFGEVTIFHYPEPDYGKALKAGVERATGDIVICDEIDLLLPEFYDRALACLSDGDADMVIGSKTLSESEDERPLGRRAATFLLNMLLRVFLGFRGSDTHGVKAFRKEVLMPVIERCLVGRDIFSSELVIRAERDRRISIEEVPVNLHEKRPPSVHLFRRVPKVISNLFYLFWVIRIKRDV